MEQYKQKFVIILDPLQLLHRLFMVYQKYTRKVLNVDQFWHPMTVLHMNALVWLSEILTPLREHPSNIEDTFDFVTRILSSKSGPNHMISFDVKSLFTKIPIDLVINQILEKSFPDKKALFHSLTHSQFKKLLIWTTKETTTV